MALFFLINIATFSVSIEVHCKFHCLLEKDSTQVARKMELLNWM